MAKNQQTQYTPYWCPTCDHHVGTAHVTDSFSCLVKSGMTPQEARMSPRKAAV